MAKNFLLDSVTPGDAQKMYYDLVETSQDLIWQCNSDGQYTYLNPVWEKTLGYRIDEMIGRKFSDFQSPEIAKRDRQEVTRLLQHGEVKGYETTLLSKSEKKLHLIFNVTFVYDDKGVITGSRGTAYDVTERKENEIKLTESETKFRMMFDQSPISKAIVGLDKLFIRCNEAFCRFLGYAENELIGKKIADITHPEDIALSMQELQQIVEGKKENATIQKRYLRKDGTVVWGEIKIGLVRNEENQPLYFLPAIIDITDRKKAEESLRKSESNYRTLLEQASDGIFISDIKGAYVFTNNRAQTMLGYTAEEMLLLTIKDLFVPEDIAQVPIKFKELNDGCQVLIERRLLRKDGSIITAEISAIQMPDGRLQAIVRDITERKHVENALRESEERFRIISSHSTEGIMIHTNGMVLDVNEAFLKIIGVESAKTVIGKDCFTFTALSAASNKLIQGHARANSDAWYAIEIEGIAGRKIFAETNGVAINYHGHPARLVRMIDITQRKQAEEEREKLNHQINQMQKLESLGLLAGGIAHDFNNLLGGMFGYVDMAKSSLDNNNPQEAREDLVKAFGVFDRTKALTKQLLTFAKGGAPIRSTLNLTPIIESSIQFALSGSNVTSEIAIAEDLWSCDCDGSQIGQVIDNIVINAQQAMPLGGSIRVSAVNVCFDENKVRRGLESGNFVKISLQDKGPGIAKEVLSKIFDPFFTTKALGHGLGLATVYSIVKRHGGWIDVESAQGKGTTFHIYLPASPTTSSTELNNKINEFKGGGLALIMDDENFMLETEGAMLKSMGYEIVKVKEGQEALALFTEAHKSGSSFILTILDLTIPNGMGGKETVKAMRAIDATSVIIVASGYADDPVMMNPTEYGFTAKIAKPFRISELSQLLQLHLKKLK